MTTTRTIDEAKLEQFMGDMVGHLTGSMVCMAIWLGDELGLYRTLDGAGPLAADEIADRTGCHRRLVREWLDGQAAGGLIDYDAAADTYALSAEAAMALANDDAPTFLARAMSVLGAFYIDMPKIAGAYRGDGALPWGDHHPCLFDGTEWFFRPGYRAELPGWLSQFEGVAEKLAEGGSVADVGCGHGASAIVIASEYPAAQVHGFDFHGPSIDTARVRAGEAGVDVTFDVADATGYDGSYDLICFFDCLHDMGDPVGIARHAREHLNPGGTVMLVEPFALADRVTNIRENPMAALLYHASSVVCTPNSLSQDVGLGLGAQAGEARLGEIFAEAGFSHFRKVTETPTNLVLEARV